MSADGEGTRQAHELGTHWKERMATASAITTAGQGSLDKTERCFGWCCFTLHRAQQKIAHSSAREIASMLLLQAYLPASSYPGISPSLAVTRVETDANSPIPDVGATEAENASGSVAALESYYGIRVRASLRSSIGKTATLLISRTVGVAGSVGKSVALNFNIL